MNMDSVIKELVARRYQREKWSNSLLAMIKACNTDIEHERIASDRYNFELYAVQSEILFLQSLLQKLGV